MPHSIHVSVIPAGPPEAEIVSLGAMLNFLRITQPAGTTTPTSGDPVTDDLINALIVGARQMLEQHTWRSLAKKNYVQYMDTFPHWHYDGYGAVSGARRIYNRGHHREHQAIKLWYPPLISCNQITYIGLDGNSYSLTSGTDFQVDFATEPGRILPLEGQFWPDTMYGVANAVQIAYTAGYEVQSAEEPAGETDDEAVGEPETEQVSNHAATQQVASYSVDRTIPEPLVTAVKMLVVHWYQNRDSVTLTPGAGGVHTGLPWHIDQMAETYRCWDWALGQETGY
jgi:hypothetical protein